MTISKGDYCWRCEEYVGSKCTCKTPGVLGKTIPLEYTPPPKEYHLCECCGKTKIQKGYVFCLDCVIHMLENDTEELIQLVESSYE